MIDIISYGKLKSCGKQKKKKQIILCHTSREVGEYLTSLEFRYSSDYDKIPNYLVDRSGKIYKLLEDEEYGKMFDVENINRNSIIICLENLGWLEKKPLSNDYINWIGNIYNGKPYEKKWRDYFFWEPYTDSQVKSLASLCKNIVDEHKIEKKCVGHNTTIKDIDKMGGIVSKSNFDKRYTDLSPAFDFQKFTKQIQDEQLV